MLITIIFLPLLGFSMGIFFGNFLTKGVRIFTTFCVLLSLISLKNFILEENIYIVELKPWIYSSSLDIS